MASVSKKMVSDSKPVVLETKFQDIVFVLDGETPCEIHMSSDGKKWHKIASLTKDKPWKHLGHPILGHVKVEWEKDDPKGSKVDVCYREGK